MNAANAREAMGDYIEVIRREGLKTKKDRDIMAIRENYQKKKGLGG